MPRRPFVPRALPAGVRALAPLLIAMAFAVTPACSPQAPSEPSAGSSNLDISIGSPCTTINGQSWCGVELVDHPTSAGSATYQAAADGGAGSFTLVSNGYGARIYRQDDEPDHSGSDGVHFVYTPWSSGDAGSGDLEIVVRLTATAILTPPPYVNPNMMAGVMIRETTDPHAQMASGFMEPLNGGNCTEDSTHPIGSFFISCRNSLRPGDPASFVLAQSEPLQFTGRSPVPTWLRLQRVGHDVAFARSYDGITWIPMGGGEFSADNALVGFFVGGAYNTNQELQTTATFDSVYVGPPRLAVRTSWIGSSFVAKSTDYASRSTDAFYVAPDGTSIKYAMSAAEDGHNFDKIDGATGRPVKIPLANNGAGFIGVYQGGLAGDGQHLYVARDNDFPSLGSFFIERRTLSTLAVDGQLTFSSSLGQISGIAAGAGFVYVSDRTNNKIHIVDSSSLQELSGTSGPHTFTFATPGPIAVDHAGRLWIAHSPTPYPSINDYNNRAGNFGTLYRFTVDDLYANQSNTFCPIAAPALTSTCPLPTPLISIDCYHNDGTPCLDTSNQRITIPLTAGDIANPTALAIGPNPTDPRIANPANDKLYIADNGPHQNIRICTGLGGQPNCTTSFGVNGGVFATPAGLVNPTGSTTPRLFGLAGLGVDQNDNVYVAQSAPQVEIAKFTPAGSRLWTYSGLLRAEPGTFDPTADGNEFYTPSRHLSLDLTKTAPGSEWSSVGVTYNPFGAYPNAERFASPGIPRPRVRWLGPTGQKQRFMYLIGPEDSRLRIYRFEGEIAIPCGSISRAPDNTHVAIWNDGSDGSALDGVPAPSEVVSPSELGGILFDVDVNGHVWLSFQMPQTDQKQIWELSPAMTTVGGILLPKYDAAQRASFAIPNIPNGFSGFEIAYDADQDAMYFNGGIPLPAGVADPPTCQASNGCPCGGGQPAIARYDLWHGATPTFTYVAKIADPRLTQTQPDDFVTRASDPICSCSDWSFTGFAIAADYFFVTERQGEILVYNAHTGAAVTRLSAGPEVDGFTGGWYDPPHYIQAFRRKNGEYLVSANDSSSQARALLFRWTPPGCGPSSVITPPPSKSASACHEFEAVTVGTATATDGCGGESLTVSGQVIASNGARLATPIPVTNGQALLGAGTHIVEWTVPGRSDIPAARQLVLVAPSIEADSTFAIDDNGQLTDARGGWSVLLNRGTGAVTLGLNTRAGGILGDGSVSLSASTVVSGDLFAPGTISIPPGATVTGSVQTKQVTLPALPSLPTFPAPTLGNVVVSAGITRNLAAGSYGTVNDFGGTLILGSGDYYFTSLFIGANATLRATATTRVFAQSLTLNRPFLAPTGTAVQPVYLGFSGTTLSLPVRLDGTLLAPNAAVTFAASTVNTGSYLAHSLHVPTGSQLVCSLPPAPPAPSCGTHRICVTSADCSAASSCVSSCCNP